MSSAVCCAWPVATTVPATCAEPAAAESACNAISRGDGSVASARRLGSMLPESAKPNTMPATCGDVAAGGAGAALVASTICGSGACVALPAACASGIVVGGASEVVGRWGETTPPIVDLPSATDATPTDSCVPIGEPGPETRVASVAVTSEAIGNRAGDGCTDVPGREDAACAAKTLASDATPALIGRSTDNACFSAPSGLAGVVGSVVTSACPVGAGLVKLANVSASIAGAAAAAEAPARFTSIALVAPGSVVAASALEAASDTRIKIASAGAGPAMGGITAEAESIDAAAASCFFLWPLDVRV